MNALLWGRIQHPHLHATMLILLSSPAQAQHLSYGHAPNIDHVPLLNHSSQYSGYYSYLEAVPFIGALACLSMGKNHLCDWGEGKPSRKEVASTAVGFHSLVRTN